MNGDTGKLYATSPEPIMVAPPSTTNAAIPTNTNTTNTNNIPDYTAMNGAVTSNTSNNNLQQQTGTPGGGDLNDPQDMNAVAARNSSPNHTTPVPNNSTDSATGGGANMPLEQLKQLLSTQLDYYFSR